MWFGGEWAGSHPLSLSPKHRDSAVTSGAKYARDSEQVISVTAFASSGEYLPSFGRTRERRRSEQRDERCKSFAGVELGGSPMRSSSFVGHVTSGPRQLSTRTSLFSTLAAPALHVRDVDFVRVVHISTYVGTGADSRVGLASAPAIPMQVPAVSNGSSRQPQRPTRYTSRPSRSRPRASITA